MLQSLLGWRDPESEDAKVNRLVFHTYVEKLIGALYEAAEDIHSKQDSDIPLETTKAFFDRAPRLMKLIGMTSLVVCGPDGSDRFTLTDKGEVLPPAARGMVS